MIQARYGGGGKVAWVLELIAEVEGITEALKNDIIHGLVNTVYVFG